MLWKMSNRFFGEVERESSGATGICFMSTDLTEPAGMCGDEAGEFSRDITGLDDLTLAAFLFGVVPADHETDQVLGTESAGAEITTILTGEGVLYEIEGVSARV